MNHGRRPSALIGGGGGCEGGIRVWDGVGERERDWDSSVVIGRKKEMQALSRQRLDPSGTTVTGQVPLPR